MYSRALNICTFESSTNMCITDTACAEQSGDFWLLIWVGEDFECLPGAVKSKTRMNGAMVNLRWQWQVWWLNAFSFRNKWYKDVQQFHAPNKSAMYTPEQKPITILWHTCSNSVKCVRSNSEQWIFQQDLSANWKCHLASYRIWRSRVP